MVYRPPYPWYFDPPAYLLIRNEGVQFTIQGGVNIPWGSKYHMTGVSRRSEKEKKVRKFRYRHPMPKFFGSWIILLRLVGAGLLFQRPIGFLMRLWRNGAAQSDP